MSSPAERYAAARRRTAHPALSDFTADLGFSLDPFQVEACEALERGLRRAGLRADRRRQDRRRRVRRSTRRSPRAARRSTRRRSRRCPTRSTPTWSSGTAPTKVGLLTGDNAVNGDAPVVVMTTEVLRNMLYADSPALDRPRLRGHGRGALPRRPVPRRGLGGGDHPPPAVGHPGLAVGDGQQRRGVRRLAGHRPRRHRRSSSARSGRCRCGSTCWSATGCSTCSRCGPAAHAGEQGDTAARACPPASAAPRSSTPSWCATSASTSGGSTPGTAAAAAARGATTRTGPRYRPPARSDVIDRLDRAGLLPAITFVFSRNGCDAAVAPVPAAPGCG